MRGSKTTQAPPPPARRTPASRTSSGSPTPTAPPATPATPPAERPRLALPDAPPTRAWAVARRQTPRRRASASSRPHCSPRRRRATSTSRRGRAPASSPPAPRGGRGICWYQLGPAAIRRGALRGPRRFFEQSRDTYRRAVLLAAAAGRPDLVALYGRGLALAKAASAGRDSAVR